MPEFYQWLCAADDLNLRELFRQTPRERHFLVEDCERLPAISEQAVKGGCWLVSLLACDERALEDNAVKVYCVLSDPQGELVTLEVLLVDAGSGLRWRSLRPYFAAAVPLEQEMADLFGIAIDGEPLLGEEGERLGAAPSSTERPVLLGPYPADYRPLRRDATAKPSIPGGEGTPDYHPVDQNLTASGYASPPPTVFDGMMILPVGPIHAGVIQPGYFAFHVAGEVVEELPIQLGYTHRGIEKLFERRPLVAGWELAERVAGDSAFGHALAYCHAVERLAGVEVSEPAVCWRGLLLELERLSNHLADCAAIVHDMAFDALSSPMAVIQEDVVRLGAALTGHRLLRGVTRPGGVVLDPERIKRVLPLLVAGEVQDLLRRFLELAIPVIEHPACRDRLISTGVLPTRDARGLGATGLAARASGLDSRDFRLRHPEGIYLLPEVRAEIEQTIQRSDNEASSRWVLARVRDLTGDVFARTLLRLAEAETSARIIGIVAKRLDDGERAGNGGGAGDDRCRDIGKALRQAHNFDFGIGYAEGWRGEICYWIMKGPWESIYRCKVRDPSVFNWRALARAVERKKRREGEPGIGEFHENILADFPLINKSFNLSYAGRDL